MSSGSLEVTLVSASVFPYIPFENEPCDTYAILKCTKDQHCTKNARDQGRLPVWNETFVFDLQEQDMSNELVIQVFNVRSEVDELLGLARIPIYTMLGKEEATLCALISPTQREIGKLKAAWKWKPESQRSLKASSFQKQTFEEEDYSRESCTSEPFNPDLPYKSMKAISYERKESGMQGYAEGGSYPAGAAAYGPKVPHYGGDSGMAAYPNNMSSDPYSKLDALSDTMAKLAVDKEGSGRSSSSYLENSRKFGKEAEGQGGDRYHEPSAPFEVYPTVLSSHAGYPDIRASDEGKGDFGAYTSSAIHARGLSDHNYPSAPPTSAYPVHEEGYSPYSGTTYPPATDAYPPNKDNYPPHSGAAYPPPSPDVFLQEKDRYPPYPGGQYPPPSSDTFPQGNDGYPPYPGSTHLPPPPPPPPSDTYTSSSGAYPPNREAYPPYPNSTYPSYSDRQGMLSSDVHGEGLAYMEKGGGSKEKGGSKKEKEKGHGSQAPYGQPPPGGYQYPPASHGYPPVPQGYPQGPHGYPPAPQGYPQGPHGYPPAPQGYSQAPHGYPPAQHGYPPAPHGYPPPPHGYPSAPQGPPYGYPQHAAPYGYPGSGKHSGHYPEKHGHAAGAYVGHSSSPSKKHKEPKHSSSHKHYKHKKQKSFKGLKFKKFKF